MIIVKQRKVDYKDEATWRKINDDMLVRGLQELDIEHEVTTEFPDDATKEDLLIMQHYQDYLEPELLECGATRCGHVHGSGVHWFQGQVDRIAEREMYDKYLDMVTVNVPGVKEYYQRYFPNLEIHVSGFPMDLPKMFDLRKKYEKEPNTIFVGGRHDMEKQFYLNVYLLQPFLENGFTVTFSYVPSNLNLGIDYDRLRDLGFIIEEFSHEDLLIQLAKSEVFHTAALGETGSVGLAEAIACGCYPSVPRLDGPIASINGFGDMVSDGYVPFDSYDIIDRIMTRPNVTTNISYFDYCIVAMNFDEIHKNLDYRI